MMRDLMAFANAYGTAGRRCCADGTARNHRAHRKRSCRACVASLPQRIIPSVAFPEQDVGTPLTDEEFERLMEFLDEHVSFGGEGFFGLLHAVAVAPSPIPASRWMSVVLPEQGLAATRAPEQIIAHVVQSLCEVMSALAQQIAMTPPEDDEAACEQFAAGYVAGAELDPEWRGNADRWTFAGPFAYLCGRRDLVPARMLGQIETANSPAEARSTVCRQMGSLVIAAHDSFLPYREASAIAQGSPVRRSTPRVGRNEPCPCGSGKKYKKCCGAS
jgi:uncharacterized protein